MKYRTLGRTGLKVGEIGIGTEHVAPQPQPVLNEVISLAIEHGVNYIDFFYPQAQYRDSMGRALEGKRDKVVIAGHLGAVSLDGQYHRTRDPRLCEDGFHDLLRRLKTDCIDVMMLHYIDEMSDLRESLEGPFMELAQKLLRQGKARYLGMSTHEPAAGTAAVQTGMIDTVMFSINPAFDILGHIGSQGTEERAVKRSSEFTREDAARVYRGRKEFYSLCVRENIGITAMKPYAAGWLLSGKTLKKPFTPVQCLHFALTRPAAAAAVPGVRDVKELEEALQYVDADDDMKDCSALIRDHDWSLRGNCMYCSHCLPCPSRIDIAQTIRLIDAAGEDMTDQLRKEYASMTASASDCIQCGDCEQRCPFGVPVISRMEEGTLLFQDISCP